MVSSPAGPQHSRLHSSTGRTLVSVPVTSQASSVPLGSGHIRSGRLGVIRQVLRIHELAEPVVSMASAPNRDSTCNVYCWALQTTNSTQRPGSPKNTTQHHDVSVQSTLDRRPMYYSQNKNGPVESECKLNNVNPHIIRNQIQIQIEVTLNEHRYCKLCHYQTNTEF